MRSAVAKKSLNPRLFCFQNKGYGRGELRDWRESMRAVADW